MSAFNLHRFSDIRGERTINFLYFTQGGLGFLFFILGFKRVIEASCVVWEVGLTHTHTEGRWDEAFQWLRAGAGTPRRLARVDRGVCVCVCLQAALFKRGDGDGGEGSG